MSSDSEPSPPPTPRGRRGSKDFPPNFSLHCSSTEFLDLYEQNKEHLKKIINELQEISAKIQRTEKNTEFRQTVAFFTLSVGLFLVIVFTLFTGGPIFFALGEAASVVAAAFGISVFNTFKKDTKDTENKLKSLRAEFRTIINSLKEKLEKVEKFKTEEKETNSDRINLLELENIILKVKCEIISIPALVDSDRVKNTLRKLEPLLQKFQQTLDSYICVTHEG